MKKIILLIISVLVLIIASGIALFTRLGTTPQGLPLFPTPTPIGAPNDITRSTTRVLSLSPQDKAENVSTQQNLEAVFNKPALGISFALYPNTAFTIATQASKITISFPQALETNTVYTYSFLDLSGKIIVSGTFSTGTQSNSVAPLSASYSDLEETANVSQRENYPDVYLASYTPFDAPSFSVASDFTTESVGHFFFTVTQKNQNGKADFIKWLASLQFTDEEVQRLDVRYQ